MYLAIHPYKIKNWLFVIGSVSFDRLWLQELIKSVAIVHKKRKVTKPTKGSKLKRLASKTRQGLLKSLRGKVNFQ